MIILANDVIKEGLYNIPNLNRIKMRNNTVDFYLDKFRDKEKEKNKNANKTDF